MRGGAVHLDVALHRVWHGGAELHLTPKAFDVLRLLVDRAGELVAKQEILAGVWPEVAVTDWVLTTAVREIRRALGDNPRAPRYLETVHRLGYRFIGPTRAGPLASAEPRAGPGPPAMPLFVGRDAEIAELDRWVAAACAGDRQLVFVTGEPGIGKTAVVDALAPRLPAAARVGRGQCVDHHGSGEAYLPFLDALGRLARADPGGEVVAVIERWAPTWLAQMPASIPADAFDALQRRNAGTTPERMLREMAEALEALAAARPLVLVLEDLHWSDRGTVDLLSMLARRREPARLLIVGTCRPVELVVRDHPLKVALQEMRSHAFCRELALEYLSELDVRAYLAARFAGGGGLGGAAEAVARLVHGRTRGNPLFVVTMTDFLVRRGAIVGDEGAWRVTDAAAAIAAEIPPGLKPAIEEQLDGTSLEDLALLEAAGLAGQTFSAATLAAVLDGEQEAIEERCATLARRGQCIRATGPVSWPDGTVAEGFEFVHALHVDVLAARPGAARRQRVHRRIGERLEAAYGARADEIATELARHFEHGGDPDRAVEYLQQAADTALRRGAPLPAVVSLTRGLELLTALPAGPDRDRRELSLQVALGAALTGTRGYVAPEVERAYARAWELCRQSEDVSQLLPVAGLYRHAVVRGEHRKGHALAERMLRLAEGVQDQTLFMVGHAMLGNILFWLGDLVAGRAHLERSIGLYDLPQHRFLAFVYGDDPQVASLSFLAFTLWLNGSADSAVQRSGEALQLAAALDHPSVSALAHNLAAQLLLLRREGAAADLHAAQAAALAEAHGLPLFGAVAAILRGGALVEQDRTDAGVEQLQRGLAAYRAIGADSGLPQYLAMLAEAQLRAGDGAAAFAAASEGLAVADRTQERWWEAELHRLQGMALPDDARRPCLQRAIDVARAQQAAALELRATVGLARLLAGNGRAVEARRTLSAVYGRFREGLDTRDLRDAQALLADLA